jgi:hypothetical protein
MIDFVFQNSKDGKIYFDCLTKMHSFTANVIMKRIEEKTNGIKSNRKFDDFLDVLLRYVFSLSLSVFDVLTF